MTGYGGLDPCVHCGFCLQSCPTYLVTGDESDSPRGRIVLMQALQHHGANSSDPTLAFHLDRCLGCRACEPACPSGVQYGAALEHARSELASVRPVPALSRLVNQVMAEPLLRNSAMFLARAARPAAAALAGPSRFGFAMGMLGATKFDPGGVKRDGVGRQTARRASTQTASPTAAGSTPAIVFRGCIMQGLFAHVHDATERTLQANGVTTTTAPGQTCCGALHAHSGQHDAAVTLAKKNVRVFTKTSPGTIVVNSAGCGAMLKEYGALLAGDTLEEPARRLAARVRDVSEVLADRGPRRGAALDLSVAYDPPCHLLHAQGVSEAPGTVLDAIPGLERPIHQEAEMCCGSAGSYSLTEPELSKEILARKIGALSEVQPNVVATGNPGCVMQIGAGLAAAGLPVPVVHPVEVLDWSYRKAGFYDP